MLSVGIRLLHMSAREFDPTETLLPMLCSCEDQTSMKAQVQGRGPAAQSLFPLSASGSYGDSLPDPAGPDCSFMAAMKAAALTGAALLVSATAAVADVGARLGAASGTAG
jgi:hypothetical protein